MFFKYTYTITKTMPEIKFLEKYFKFFLKKGAGIIHTPGTQNYFIWLVLSPSGVRVVVLFGNLLETLADDAVLVLALADEGRHFNTINKPPDSLTVKPILELNITVGVFIGEDESAVSSVALVRGAEQILDGGRMCKDFSLVDSAGKELNLIITEGSHIVENIFECAGRYANLAIVIVLVHINNNFKFCLHNYNTYLFLKTKINLTFFLLK